MLDFAPLYVVFWYCQIIHGSRRAVFLWGDFMAKKNDAPIDGAKKTVTAKKSRAASKAKKKTAATKTGTKKDKSPYGELQTFGKPRRFPSDRDFQASFEGYIEHCLGQKLQPNISGYCVYCDMTRDTFYAQQQHYPDTYKKVRHALEDTLVNFQRFTGLSNPAMAIVQGKNTFKWDDSGKGGGDSLHIDVDFDADSDEIDNLMSKLGYQPLLTD